MAKPLYRVKDFGKHFLKSDSKKSKTMQWVATPTKHDGKSYRRLMRSDPTFYLAWTLILQVSCKCPVRGLLADGDGSLDADDLSMKTDCPATIFQKAFGPLCEAGWLERIDDVELATQLLMEAGGPDFPNRVHKKELVKKHPDAIPTPSRQHPETVGTASRRHPDAIPTTGQDITVHDKTVTASVTPKAAVTAVKVIESQKPTAEPPKQTAWGIWIDLNKARGRSEPIAVGPDLSASKNLWTALKCNVEEYTRVCKCFLADADQFLINKGHALRHLAERVNKYGKATAQSTASPIEAAIRMKKAGAELK